MPGGRAACLPGPRGQPFPTAADMAEGVHRRTHGRNTGRAWRVCDVPANAAPAQSGAAIRHKTRVKNRGGRSGRGGTLGRTGTCVRVRVDSLHPAPPGQKVLTELLKTACPHSCKIFSPRANVWHPGPEKNEKGRAFPIATGPGQSGKPCARAVPCACAGEAPRQKNAGRKTCKGAPGLYMRQRCSIGAAHGLAQTLAKTA